jgi:DNA-directed RNA polymerase subunit RPC12/RpoP
MAMTEIEVYACPICDKLFDSIWDARECAGSHVTPTKNYKCSICGIVKWHPHCCTIDSVAKKLETLEEAFRNNKGTVGAETFEKFYCSHKEILLKDLELLKKEAN